MKKNLECVIFSLFFSFTIFDVASLADEVNSSNQFASIDNKILLEDSSLQMDSYLIGPGDVISLNFYNNLELNNQYEVLANGSLHLPLVGSIEVKNKTLNQATKLIESSYREHLLAPELYLTLSKRRPLSISLIGEVLRPGLYSFAPKQSSLTNSGLPTVVDAIQKAGGITQFADIEEVILTRRIPSDSLSRKRTSLNLLNLILKGEHYQNVILHDGDVIKINKTKNLKYENLDIAVANLSPKKINVTILGEVNSPGPISLNANTPLVKAIYQAGGPKVFSANYSNVALIRTNRDGSSFIEKYKINLKEKLSALKNPPLSDGDVVKVYPNSLKKVSDGLSVVTDPLSKTVTAITVFKYLTD